MSGNIKFLKIRQISFCASLFLSILLSKVAVAQTAPVLPPLFPESESQPDLNKEIPTPEPVDPLSLPSGIDQGNIAPDIKITIHQFKYKGNSIFTKEEIDAVLEPFIGQSIFTSELVKIEEAITKLYSDANYTTSGASIIPKNFDPEKATIEFLIVEGEITEIKVTGATRLVPYIKQQLGPLRDKPLNRIKLFNYLRFLLDKQIIKKLSVNIQRGGRLDQNILLVKVEAGHAVEGTVSLNNGRSSSIGTVERGGSLTHWNLLGSGDTLSVNYRNTDGSNLVSVDYSLPVTPKDGTLSLGVFIGKSTVVEKPFDQFNLDTNSQEFSVNFRQPLLRRSSNSKLEEFAVSLGVDRRESEDTFDGIPFPLSDGPDFNGKYRSTVLSIGQDYALRSRKNILLLNSEFRFGLPVGTKNDPFFVDGAFFKVRGQGVFARRINDRVLSLSRGIIQFSDRDLAGSEQFFLGGIGTVRGTRTAENARNNGYAFTQEVRFLVFEAKNHRMEIAPFIDVGGAWNGSNQFLEKPVFVGSVGMSLYYQFSDRIRASIQYGYPVFGDFSRKDNSVFFSAQFRL